MGCRSSVEKPPPQVAPPEKPPTEPETPSPKREESIDQHQVRFSRTKTACFAPTLPFFFFFFSLARIALSVCCKKARVGKQHMHELLLASALLVVPLLRWMQVDDYFALLLSLSLPSFSATWLAVRPCARL